MVNYGLGVGPMSKEIIELIPEYGLRFPLMVVASRNQVDYNSGYVCTTKELAYAIPQTQIFMCRDHCGPYFKDSDKGLTVEQAMEECKKTILEDLKNNFNQIHVDVSRIPENQFKYARELIELIINTNPKTHIEFGSENNTGTDLAPSMERIDEQLAFISQFKRYIKFFVTQTGSFTQHTQVGTFDIDFVSPIVRKVHNAGFKFKEHNADYLTREEVAKRKLVGVNAMNIAPQLGAVQTRILYDLARGNSQWVDFANKVYESEMWKKWMPQGVDDKELSVIVSAHYLYQSDEYKRVVDSINRDIYMTQLRHALFSIFNTYNYSYGEFNL